MKCGLEENVIRKNFRAADQKATIKQGIAVVKEKWKMAVFDRKKILNKYTKAMETQLKRLYENGITLIANTSKKGDFQIMKFIDGMRDLFDVCTCICPQISCDAAECKTPSCDKVHLKCSCDVKVPKRGLKFLFDQRGPGKMYILGVDEIVTSMWERAARREQRKKERVGKKQRDGELFEKGMEFEECNVQ